MNYYIRIREFKEEDLESIIKAYKKAFAEPPWNEFVKCKNCGAEYGEKEMTETIYEGRACKNCGAYPIAFQEYWTKEDIIDDLKFCQNQENPIILVALENEKVAGFTWGYKIPFEKFPFLKGLIPENAIYMDEMAVRGDKRMKGIGTMLGKEFLKRTKAVVLRTDERNEASMALYKKLGFKPVTDGSENVYDPVYPNRIYLGKW